MVKLRWIASSSASALAAAQAILNGVPLADSTATDTLSTPAQHLRAALAAAAVPVDGFFQHALPLAAGIENDRQLATLALTKLIGSRQTETAASPVAAALAGLETVYRQVLPGVVAELETRSLPLREQWEARGDGLLAQIGRLTDRSLIVESADVLLTMPIRGGGGEAFWHYNAVAIEAVLVNPQAALHEVVRLCWLLALLHLDLPRFSEDIPASRRATVLRLAMVPATLTAAEHVEWVASANQILPLALDTWALADRAPRDTPQIVRDWWHTYQQSPVDWRVALKALDQMLFPDATN